MCCQPLQKYIVIPRNMLQFWQRNILFSPAEIQCNFGKEIYCHPLQKYVAILAVADFPEGPPLDKGNFGQSDKNVFLLNRTFLHFQLNFFRGLQKEVLKYSCDKQYIACTQYFTKPKTKTFMNTVFPTVFLVLQVAHCIADCV